MSRLVPCPECSGTGRLDFDRCPGCAGVRTVYDYTATRQLGAVLCDELGSNAALDVLLDHRDLLRRWCDEQSVFERTGWALVDIPGEKDGWGHTGPPSREARRVDGSVKNRLWVEGR